tara:strand:+ start:665 stop:1336 length:672 start_codon:yes stop_codon:yes gene_type:complete
MTFNNHRHSAIHDNNDGTAMANKLTLHDDPISGNGYKVRLLLAFLGIDYDYVRYDILKAETRTKAFLKRLNPNGRIPVLELEDGTPLAESNAILCYLADGTVWWPSNRLHRARTLQWMFFEQYSHEPNVATLRFWNHLPALTPAQETARDGKFTQGCAALSLMNTHLAQNPWFVGEMPTVADIAFYAYTHVAHEGGFNMAPYAAIAAWLKRVEALPGYVGMTS